MATPENMQIRRLLVDKGEFASEIAKEMEGFVRIDPTSQTPILPFPLRELRARDRILVQLGTSYLCLVGGIVSVATVSREDLRTRCRIPAAVLRARLADLRNEQLVNSTPEGEEITTEGLIEFRELLRSVRARQEHHEGKQ